MVLSFIQKKAEKQVLNCLPISLISRGKKVIMTKLFGKYGLPLEVKFCKKCTMNNQRHASTVEFMQKEGEKKRTLAFGDDGVCDACRYAEQKKSIKMFQLQLK